MADEFTALEKLDQVPDRDEFHDLEALDTKAASDTPPRGQFVPPAHPAAKIILGSPLSGTGEAALSAVTGGVGALGGGLTYLGTLAATGGNTEAAKSVQEDTQSALTYHPRTETGQRYAQNVGNVMSYLGPKEGEYVGDKLADAGHPLLGAAANTAIQALPMLLPLKAGRGAKGAVAPDMAPGTIFGDSGGAAAAAPDLAVLSPELRSSFEKAAQQGPLNREVVGRHIEADTLPVPMKLTEGQATQDPSLLSKEQNARGKNPELARVFNEQNGQLIDNLDEIRASASPNTVWQDHIQNGQTLVDAYKAADAPVKADINAKYEALRSAAGGEFPVDGAQFVSNADAALEQQLKSEFVPPSISGQLTKFRDGKRQMTYENFESLRTNLAAEARKADRSGDGNASHAISVVREALENLPLKDGAENLKPLADTARSAAKARFDRLREDPAYRAAVDDDAVAGEPSSLADNFVQKYVIKGKQSHLQKMRENLAEMPEANEVIAGGVLNYLKSKSGVNLYTNEGNFSQAGYNRALSEVMPKIGELLGPKAAEQVQALGNVSRYTQAQPRGSFVNNSNTFVASMADHAANVLEGVANVKAGGIPVGSYLRNKMSARGERKFVERATASGAGVSGGTARGAVRPTTNIGDLLRGKK